MTTRATNSSSDQAELANWVLDFVVVLSSAVATRIDSASSCSCSTSLLVRPQSVLQRLAGSQKATKEAWPASIVI